MSIFGPTAGELVSAKHRLLGLVADAGATLAVIGYSGGNDEGGADSVTLYKGTVTGRTFVEKHFGSYGSELPEGFEKLEYEDPEAWDENYDNRNAKSIVGQADQLLSGEFGTWAGEFSAYGALYVIPGKNEVWRKGTYEVSSGDEDGRSY